MANKDGGWHDHSKWLEPIKDQTEKRGRESPSSEILYLGRRAGHKASKCQQWGKLHVSSHESKYWNLIDTWIVVPPYIYAMAVVFFGKSVISFRRKKSDASLKKRMLLICRNVRFLDFLEDAKPQLQVSNVPRSTSNYPRRVTKNNEQTTWATVTFSAVIVNMGRAETENPDGIADADEIVNGRVEDSATEDYPRPPGRPRSIKMGCPSRNTRGLSSHRDAWL